MCELVNWVMDELFDRKLSTEVALETASHISGCDRCQHVFLVELLLRGDKLDSDPLRFPVPISPNPSSPTRSK